MELLTWREWASEATWQKRWRYGRVKLFSMSIKFVVNWDVAAVPAVMLHLLEQTLLLQFSWKKKKNHSNKKWIFLDLNSTHIVWTDRPSAARLISFYTFLFFFFFGLSFNRPAQRKAVCLFPPSTMKTHYLSLNIFHCPWMKLIFFFVHMFNMNTPTVPGQLICAVSGKKK